MRLAGNTFRLLLLMVLYSCTTYVSEELPLPEQKLVVNSIFSADSLFKAQIMLPRTYTYRNSGFDTVKNARVEIMKNGQSLETLSYHSDGFYRSDTLRADDYGAEYQISVSAPDLPEATSSDTLAFPPNVGVPAVEYVNNGDESGYQVTLPLIDPAKTNDYYFIAAYSIADLNYGDTVISFPDFAYISFADPIEEFNTGFKYGFTDRSFNGQTYNLRFTVDSSLDSITLVVGKTSRAFHKYYRSYEKQSNEDSFLTPIVEVANNINNGYGIFAGYSVKKFRLSR